MAQQEMAWPRQPEDRQWKIPEDDDPRTLYQMLMVSVDRFADSDCFGFIPAPGMKRIHISYREFGELTTSVAKSLRDIGVEKRDRVALIVDNSVEWAATAFGANALGAGYTAMYTHQHAKDWEFILGDSTPKVVLIADTGILDKMVAGLQDDAWPSAGVILLGNDEPNELPPEGVKIHRWSEFVAAGRKAEDLAEIADDHTALSTLIYTSGTTGNPKGVILSNWNTISNVLCVQGVFELYPGDKNAAFLPWAHSFGSTFDLHWMIRMGVHINLISDLTRIADECIEIKPAALLAVPRVWSKFYDRVNSQFEGSPVKRLLSKKAKKHAAKRIAKSGIQCDSVPPSGFFDKFYDKILWSKVRARFGGNIRFCMSGAAALSPEVAGFVQMVGFSCYEGYGLTETSPLVSANGWMGKGGSRLNSVGRPVNGVTVTIDKDAWDDPESPDEGEVIVHGPNIMGGYWNLPEATAEVMTADGGFRTGDLGKMVDGYLSITGRVKSQFKLENGKYVSPAPLEENLKLSPLVEQAVLDGRNLANTFLIVHPNLRGLRSELTKAGVNAPDSDADLCNDSKVKEWFLANLAKNNMVEPKWKRYEVARSIILDPVEWSVDNDMMTPSLKVKLRNLLTHHEDAVKAI
ncbi:MAG: AMP-dependent synthetase/ligase [Candidatus Poseidoniales archaeon]